MKFDTSSSLLPSKGVHSLNGAAKIRIGMLCDGYYRIPKKE